MRVVVTRLEAAAVTTRRAAARSGGHAGHE